MNYEATFVWLRSWCCLTCKTIFCGREQQCPHCLTPKNPLPFA